MPHKGPGRGREGAGKVAVSGVARGEISENHSRGVATKRAEWEENFMWAVCDWKFVPAARIWANAANGGFVTFYPSAPSVPLDRWSVREQADSG
ncbi:MAG: hypothetical protein H0T73_20235 [Ardenticatenales bacterium]|nr:hypothetical protein [Ardenticatenales bacterium]